MLDGVIKVTGSWDNWKNKLNMKKNVVAIGSKTLFTKKMMLKPGIY
jgi:hypothetical protein